jgi:hypothetical protein
VLGQVAVWCVHHLRYVKMDIHFFFKPWYHSITRREGRSVHRLQAFGEIWNPMASANAAY